MRPLYNDVAFDERCYGSNAAVVHYNTGRKPRIEIQKRWHSFKNGFLSLTAFKSCSALKKKTKMQIFKAHVFFISGLFQVMKPTRTSSETFHTWPPTTPRSSNAAAQTPKLNQLLPPPHPAARSSHVSPHIYNTC